MHFSNTLWLQISSKFRCFDFYLFSYVNSVLTSLWENLFKNMNYCWGSRPVVKRSQNTVTKYFVGFSLGQLWQGNLEEYVLHFKTLFCVTSVPRSQSEALGIYFVRYTLSFIYVCFILYENVISGESDWRSGHQSRLPPLRPGIDKWAEVFRSQSDSEGFSPGSPVFLPLQIRLSRQDLSRRAILKTLASG